MIKQRGNQKGCPFQLLKAGILTIFIYIIAFFVRMLLGELIRIKSTFLKCLFASYAHKTCSLVQKMTKKQKSQLK